MTFNPWLEQKYKAVSEQLEQLPPWKKEALRRDEEFTASKRESAVSEKKPGT
jgi:hypothetical protein